jgi:hypothetical protein
MYARERLERTQKYLISQWGKQWNHRSAKATGALEVTVECDYATFTV